MFVSLIYFRIIPFVHTIVNSVLWGVHNRKGDCVWSRTLKTYTVHNTLYSVSVLYGLLCFPHKGTWFHSVHIEHNTNQLTGACIATMNSFWSQKSAWFCEKKRRLLIACELLFHINWLICKHLTVNICEVQKVLDFYGEYYLDLYS